MYKNKKSGPGPPEIESSVPTHLPNHTTSLQQPKADFHDAPFSADALEKRFSPPGKLQGRSSGSSLSQRLPGPRGPVASVLRPVRNLQQRELLPIFTAFPFDRVPTRRCRCEPLRCKVTKYSGMGADIPNKIVIFAFAVCEDCVHTTKKRIGFFLTRETWKISNAVRNKS